jgi:hypothetical protein
MPDTSALSLNGAKVEATAAQTRMAGSKMHLFQFGFTPSPTSTLADFEAEEADFDGYAEKTLATWAAPILAGVGYMTYAPTQTFAWTLDVDSVGNQIGGHWLETAGGELIGYTIYDPSIPLQGAGMAVVKTPVLVYPAG